MNYQKIQNELVSISDRVSELHKVLSHMSEPPETTRLEKLGFYEPVFGDVYFYLSELAVYKSDCVLDSGVSMQTVRLGNSFKTEEDAEAAAKRNEIRADLLRNSKEYEEGELNYYIDMGLNKNKPSLECEEVFRIIGLNYFTSEIGLEMINKHGDNLKLLNL